MHLQEDAPSESGNQDALSTSSELLDLLMHEDARSGTGSNASGSGSGESGGSLGSGSGSGSNGTSTSHTGRMLHLLLKAAETDGRQSILGPHGAKFVTALCGYSQVAHIAACFQ